MSFTPGPGPDAVYLFMTQMLNQQGSACERDETTPRNAALRRRRRLRPAFALTKLFRRRSRTTVGDCKHHI